MISASASHAQLAGKLSWTDATAIRAATIITFTGLGFGNVGFGGAGDAFEGNIDRAIGTAELSRVQNAEGGLGVAMDAAGEVGEAADVKGDNASLKSAMRADWKSSKLRKGLKGAGRGLKAAGKAIAKAAKKVAKKVRRK